MVYIYISPSIGPDFSLLCYEPWYFSSAMFHDMPLHLLSQFLEGCVSEIRGKDIEHKLCIAFANAVMFSYKRADMFPRLCAGYVVVRGHIQRGWGNGDVLILFIYRPKRASGD
jgi:hypothetical protein